MPAYYNAVIVWGMRRQDGGWPRRLGSNANSSVCSCKKELLSRSVESQDCSKMTSLFVNPIYRIFCASSLKGRFGISDLRDLDE